MKRGDRVGVLLWIDGRGTCLAPAIVLRSNQDRTTVAVRKGDRLSSYTAATSYVEPPFTEETTQAWQTHWIEIENYLAEYGWETLCEGSPS